MAFLPTISFSASFNCQNASASIEKLICSDQKLNDLDEALAEQYKNIITSGNDEENKNLKSSQRAWLKERNIKCKDAIVCEKIYEERISYLKNYSNRPIKDLTPYELYQRANSGDTEAMELLYNFHISQYSPRFNPERAKYWTCRIQQVKPTEKSTIDCKDLLRVGNEKNYNIFYKSGDLIKEVVLSDDIMKNLDLIVPLEREWQIKWKKPTCEKVCSYEIAIDGYFNIGEKRGYIIGRRATISLDSLSEGEIWVSSGSKVTLQIDRKLLKITEYAD